MSQFTVTGMIGQDTAYVASFHREEFLRTARDHDPPFLRLGIKNWTEEAEKVEAQNGGPNDLSLSYRAIVKLYTDELEKRASQPPALPDPTGALTAATIAPSF